MNNFTATNHKNSYCYHKLQFAIMDFLEAAYTKYNQQAKSNEPDKLSATPEFQVLAAAQFPQKSFSAEYILNNFSSWMSEVLQPMDSLRILKNHSERIKR